MKITGKCEYCKKKASAYFKGKKLCQRCFQFIKQGNEDLIVKSITI